MERRGRNPPRDTLTPEIGDRRVQAQRLGVAAASLDVSRDTLFAILNGRAGAHRQSHAPVKSRSRFASGLGCPRATHHEWRDRTDRTDREARLRTDRQGDAELRSSSLRRADKAHDAAAGERRWRGLPAARRRPTRLDTRASFRPARVRVLGCDRSRADPALSRAPAAPSTPEMRPCTLTGAEE